MVKEVVCTTCPRGCEITVTGEIGALQFAGNGCPKGIEYATGEVTSPRRVVTSTVRAGKYMLPVKTDRPVLKTLMLDVMRKINSVKVWTSVKIGDIIISDVDGEGTNVVSAKNWTATSESNE